MSKTMADETDLLIGGDDKVIGGAPQKMITSEEELQKYLSAEVDENGNPIESPKEGDEAGKKPAAGAAAAPAKKPLAPASTASKTDSIFGKKSDNPFSADYKNPLDASDDEADDNKGAASGKKKEDDDNDEGAKPSEYPSIVHYLNDIHELNLNLEGIEKLTPEEEAETLSKIVGNVVEGARNAIGQYEYIQTLMQDTEIQEVLRAKADGKSLKDVFAKFSSSPEGLSDDVLAVQDFKVRFPKASDEAINNMVDSLKKSGQFSPFVQNLREQRVEEQRLQQEQTAKQAEEQARQEEARIQKEIEEYGTFLQNTPSVYGIPLSEEMKERLYDFTTSRDDKGMTQLDYFLQSNEGTLLAAIGIVGLKDFIQNASSINKNRARAKVVDKIFTTADKLQGGSGGRQDSEDLYKESILGQF